MGVLITRGIWLITLWCSIYSASPHNDDVSVTDCGHAFDIFRYFAMRFSPNYNEILHQRPSFGSHYKNVIMTTIASQITSLAVVYSTVYSDADQRKHQSSASLASVWGIHRDRGISRTKGQLRGKCFHLMTSPWIIYALAKSCSRLPPGMISTAFTVTALKIWISGFFIPRKFQCWRELYSREFCLLPLLPFSRAGDHFGKHYFIPVAPLSSGQ